MQLFLSAIHGVVGEATGYCFFARPFCAPIRSKDWVDSVVHVVEK